LSVPYSMVAGNLSGAVKKLEVRGDDTMSEEALFEVKRKDGETMFAVYNHGVRIFMPLDTLSKAKKGGFAIGGFDKAKGTVVPFVDLTPNNYFIGHESGISIETGLFNSIIGYQSGKTNTGGSSNVFIGYQSGFSNKVGSDNTFIGYQA